MHAEIKIMIESVTLKKLLLGLSQLEANLPYNGDGFEVQVSDVNVGICPGTYDIWAGRVDGEKKIPSIKAIRAATNMDLKEAKEAVELNLSMGTPIYMGTYTTKVEAIQAQQAIIAGGSIYEVDIKGKNGNAI